MLYLSETPLITSPGPGYDETRFQNCLLINNQGQLKGDPQQRILGKHSPLFSEVQNIQGKDDTEYAKIDITPCYEGLINYKRHLLLNNLGTFIVIDEVHPKDSSAVNIQWQTHYTFLKKNDGTYAVEGNRRGFNIHTTSTFNINAGISQHSYGQTLSLRSKHKAKHFILVTMFTPYAISSSDIDMRLEKDRLILDVQVRNKSERYIFTRTKTGLTFKKDI
jgi:hypothetical protein